jgi:hypothetical protein
MIRPILEYGNIIYDGSSDTVTRRLEHVQRQAALACTGAYRHTNHETLLDELSWPSLAKRRENHRLNVMFKIQNVLTPFYLSNICPPLTRERTNYNLHTGRNITIPPIRTTTYHKSFFPNTIMNWNDLKDETRNLPSLDAFKDKQKKELNCKPNPLYHHDSSKAAINHSRIRLGLSGLCYQRFQYKHITDPKCPTCDAKSEDTTHFFLTCPTYTTQRHNFILDICEILLENDIEVDFTRKPFRTFFLNTVLKGSDELTEAENKRIIIATQNYICETHRFL